MIGTVITTWAIYLTLIMSGIDGYKKEVVVPIGGDYSTEQECIDAKRAQTDQFLVILEAHASMYQFQEIISECRATE